MSAEGRPTWRTDTQVLNGELRNPPSHDARLFGYCETAPNEFSVFLEREDGTRWTIQWSGVRQVFRGSGDCTSIIFAIEAGDPVELVRKHASYLLRHMTSTGDWPLETVVEIAANCRTGYLIGTSYGLPTLVLTDESPDSIRYAPGWRFD